ncbi:peptidoglycan-binding domain-containing protein [Streptomyces luteireticuli]|uniref:Peptidoglycan-binding domain-containing protein n=1 Tax=Streptomyces luteireticuli TaxID=173858 RepID=A0ABN0Z7W4_9ACTN
MKRFLACLGAAAAITAGLVVTGPSAQAATVCGGSTKYYDTAGYYVDVPTTSSLGSNFCTLRRGASGDAVYQLQIALNGCYGQDVGGFDGDFGAKTENALRRVQSALGLDADGVYGPNTRDKMKWQWRNMEGSHRCLRLTQAPGPLSQ